MIRLKDLLDEDYDSPTHGSPPLDGKSKRNASSWVLGKVNKYTSGMFSDQYWQPIQRVWKELDSLGINWISTGSRYEKESVRLRDGSRADVDMRKTWTFEVKFINNRDKLDTLYGRIVAAGTGPNDSPLDRYDVNVTLS